MITCIQCAFLKNPQNSGPKNSLSAPVQAQVYTCPTPGCGQKRIAPLCQRCLCRKHCRQLGGCLVKTHLLNKASLPTNIPPPFPDVTLPLPYQPSYRTSLCTRTIQDHQRMSTCQAKGLSFPSAFTCPAFPIPSPSSHISLVAITGPLLLCLPFLTHQEKPFGPRAL